MEVIVNLSLWKGLYPIVLLIFAGFLFYHGVQGWWVAFVVALSTFFELGIIFNAQGSPKEKAK